MTFWNRLLDLLFPPKCPFCGRVLDHPGICASCQKALVWTGEKHEIHILENNIPCAAPLWYTGIVRKGHLRFKFHGGFDAAEILADLMEPCVAARLGGEFQLVTWVPVSRKRLRSRGYDQAELLAQALCRRWRKKPVRLLDKIRDNPAQSGLPGDKRRGNVRGAYRVRNRAAVKGKRILLIDDVCTTGSTLSECAQTLLNAGAQSVVCAAMAHAGMERKTEGEYKPSEPY